MTAFILLFHRFSFKVGDYCCVSYDGVYCEAVVTSVDDYGEEGLWATVDFPGYGQTAQAPMHQIIPSGGHIRRMEQIR